MLPRKLTLMLSVAAISLLVNSVHTTIAADATPAPKSKVSDRWLNRQPQKTTAQEAAEAARKARMDEMNKGIAANKGEPTTETKPTAASTEKDPVLPKEGDIKSPTQKKMMEEQKAEEAKPAEVKKVEPTPTPEKKPAVVAPVKKRLTIQEQIALNKKKKAEELLKIQEESKAGKAMPAKKAPVHAHAKATPTPHVAPEVKSEPVTKHMPTLKVETHPDKVEIIKKPTEHVTEHTLKAPLTIETHPDKVEVVKKPIDSYDTKSLAHKKMMQQIEDREAKTSPIAPSTSPKPPVNEPKHTEPAKVDHMSPTQKKIMETQNAQEEQEGKAASTASTPPKPSGDRGDLLAQIRAGKKLNPVNKEASAKPEGSTESAPPKADVDTKAKPQSLQDQLKNSKRFKELKTESEAAAAG
jgi:hypothetical protein